MKSVVFVSVVVAVGVAAVSSTSVSAYPDTNPPPFIEGSDEVHARDGSGGLRRYTAIPSGSAFSDGGSGGRPVECDGFGPGDDPATPEVDLVQPVRSMRWIYLEGEIHFDVSPWVTLPPPEAPQVGVPLSEVVRTFGVYCNTALVSRNLQGTIDVRGDDPFFGLMRRRASLYNSLQLIPITVFRNPVVNRWGGLVVRSPAWMAIDAEAWVTQRSNVEHWRGWDLTLVAQPRAMAFDVEFAPDVDRPSEPFSGTVSCVDATELLQAGSGVFPRRPNDLADFAEPGVGRCVWTPPGPGSVTVTARVTYTVTFQAEFNGQVAVVEEPDYEWASASTTFRVGELRAVNVND